MNDDDVQKQLRAFKAPEPSESAQTRARHRALIAFQQPGSNRERQPGIKNAIWNWRMAVGGAVIIAVVALFAPRFPAPLDLTASPDFKVQQHRALESVGNDRQILRQMEQLFPNQINAVVERNGKVDLSIAESRVVGSDQPLLVIFKQGDNTIRVLSYSGHRVCLMLGKARKCFEILATPTGNVILEGEDKVWLASEHPEVFGYSVRAQTLEASL